MTISSEIRTAGPFTGDSIATAFPFSFKVFKVTELIVVRTDLSNNDVTLTYGTDYSVTLNADQNASPGGTITYKVASVTAALPTGYKLNATSDIDNLQPMALTNNGGFFPKVLNDSADRLTIMVQQLVRAVNSSLKFPLSDGTGLNANLPNKASRLGKYLGFDGTTGEPTVLDGTAVNGPYYTPTSSSTPPAGMGIYAPSASMLGIAALGALALAVTNPASAVTNWEFSGQAATSPISYVKVSAKSATQNYVGMMFDTKGTTTTGSQYSNSKEEAGTYTTGDYTFKINGAKALRITDTWWNPNVSYGGACTTNIVLSSGAIAGGPDTTAVIGCESSIYKRDGSGSASGTAIQYQALGPTSQHHFVNNGYINLTISGGANPSGVNDTYCQSAYITISGVPVGSASTGVAISNQSSYNTNAPHMVFYSSQAGDMYFLTDNIATPLFRMYRTASAVNNVYSKAAITGAPAYLGAMGETNSPLGLTSNGNGDVRLCTNALAQAQAIIKHTANAVNAITLTGSATGSNVTISVGDIGSGGDATRGINYQARGTGNGNHNFYDGGALQCQIGGGSTSTTYTAIIGGSTDAAISSQGGGSSNGLTIYTSSATGTVKILTNNTSTPVAEFLSSGLFKLTNSASFLANGTGTVTTGNLAPGTSTYVIKKWMQIVDNGGTTYSVPCYGV